jgi:hypothetical protein
MKVSGVAFSLVGPITTSAGGVYVASILQLWPWVLVAAVGWTLGIVYVLRRVLELGLKKPGARIRLRAQQS